MCIDSCAETKLIKHVYTRDSYKSILANSEDQDEMQQIAAFHLVLLCLLS